MHHPVWIDNQTAVGFVAKKRLGNSEHDERVNSAANEGQHQCSGDRPSNFRKERFHRLDEMKSSDDQVDQFDADKRNNDATEAVDEEVAL